MTEERMKRKLTAILSADVVGYSRLMSDDEEATVHTLNKYRRIIFDLIERHNGRLVDAPGDNVLAEFVSVVDAVRCGVQIQEDLKENNKTLPTNRKMEFRIGIHTGDVIQEADRIYGDGVNIAARIETLADAGGICLSRTAHDQVKKKLNYEYEYLGEYEVKNIDEPVMVYRIRMELEGTHQVVKGKETAKKSWRMVIIAVAALVAIFAALAFWSSYLHDPSIESASIENMAYPLPEKPSIAVLPFTNMSGDPEQEYIGDGLSENIISALSISSEIFVMSRNATFAYKEQPTKPQKVAEDLGVQYVLEGSILKSGERLRVTAQLVDALSGHHLWSEVYNRKMKELFELLDDVTKKIMVSLQMEVGDQGEDLRLYAKSTDNLEAWKHYIKGIELYDNVNALDNQKAREHFEAALELDPAFVAALSMLAETHLQDIYVEYSDSPLTSLNRAIELAQKAVDLDEQDPSAHAVLGQAFLYQRDHEKAIFEGKRAIALKPNYAYGHVALAVTMHYSGRFEESITLGKKASRLNPNVPSLLLFIQASSYCFLERYEEALETIRRMEEQAVSSRIKANSKTFYSFVYQLLGREEEARAYMAEALKIKPDYSLENQVNAPYKDPAHLQRTLDILRKAGMPEKPPGAVQENPSIAVLPFENLSPDPEQEYFSDGLSEELINKLAQVKDLQVTARTSSFYFKNKDVDLRTIGEKLGVTYLLEGSVQKSGNQLRITAQLIKATDSYHLWSETYDRELKDIFAIQDDIAKEVTTALSVTLGVGEFISPGMTRNIQAYDEYLRACANFSKFTPDSILTAIDQFKQSLDIDPEFGLGWRLLYEIYNQGIVLLPPRQTVDFETEAAEALKLARAIAPDMPKLLMITAEKLWSNGDWLEAERIFRQILDEQGHANPDANNQYGQMLIGAGRSNDALPYLQRAKRLNPLSPAISLFLSMALFNSKRIDEAFVEARHGQTMEELNVAFKGVEILVALENNDRPRASAIIADICKPEGVYPDATMLRLAELLLMEDTEAALSELKGISERSDLSPVTRGCLAHVASELGGAESAFENIRDSEGLNKLMAFWHPIHRAIWQLPAFKTYIRDIGLYDYWRESGNWADCCRPVGDDDFVCD